MYRELGFTKEAFNLGGVLKAFSKTPKKTPILERVIGGAGKAESTVGHLAKNIRGVATQVRLTAAELGFDVMGHGRRAAKADFLRAERVKARGERLFKGWKHTEQMAKYKAGIKGGGGGKFALGVGGGVAGTLTLGAMFGRKDKSPYYPH